MYEQKIPTDKMMSLSDEIRRNDYGYVLFDNCPKSFDNARIRTGILPEDDTVILDSLVM